MRYKNGIEKLYSGKADNTSALPYFPMFIQLTGKKIVVIGAGTIAARRVTSLLDFGADIYIIAPEISEEIKNLSKAAKSNIHLFERNYKTIDCSNAFWVIAATNNRKINHQIGIDAKQNGAFATISDAKEDNVVVGITTGGRDHSLAKKITKQCRIYLGKWMKGSE